MPVTGHRQSKGITARRASHLHSECLPVDDHLPIHDLHLHRKVCAAAPCPRGLLPLLLLALLRCACLAACACCPLGSSRLRCISLLLSDPLPLL